MREIESTRASDTALPGTVSAQKVGDPPIDLERIIWDPEYRDEVRKTMLASDWMQASD